MANDKNFVVKNGLNAGGVFTAGNTTITGDASVSANLTSNNITITNGLSLGTVTSGAWTATIIAGQYGGTGVNNSGKTITLGGNLTTNGAFATVLTTTATTSVTLPTTGTLATLAGTETFTNKTFTDSTTFFQDDGDNTRKVQFQLGNITASNTRTLTVQDASGTLALTSNKLSAFAATTSLELAGVISDETGAGYLVFNTTPTFATSVDSGASFNAWASATTLTEGYTGTAASTLNLSTGSVASATTKTINIGTGGVSGSITNINFGSGISGATGTATFNNDVVITGLLTVNGTTVTLNSTTITVDDKNIELGSIASANNTTADGGGLTLKGLTDKTINWINATGAWTSSEDFDLVAGKSYKINNTLVANSTSLGTTIVGSSLTSVGTIATGVWQGTLVAGQYGGTGVNNTGRTITLAGNISTANSFTTSGNFALTLTQTAATSVTLPTTGTLSTLDGVETLTNKTLTAPTINNGGINSTLITTATVAGTGLKFNGSTSGNTTVVATSVAGTTTLTLPAATDTLVARNTTDTLTNKTLTSPSISGAILTGTLTANASVGSAGQVLTSSSTGIYWNTLVTNLADTANTSAVTVTSSTGTSAIITEANSTAAGVLTSIAQTIAGVKTFTSQPVVPSLNISAAVPYMQLSDTDATGDWRVLVNSGVFVLQSSTDTYGSNKMTVTSAGALTMLGDVTAFSDERLKTNIRTIDNALDKVSAMRGVYFDKDGRSSTGVIAQEIEKVLPEVVHDGEYKSVAYGNIVGVLIEAIKELQAKVDKLEKRV
jgi:hypothetical protein